MVILHMYRYLLQVSKNDDEEIKVIWLYQHVIRNYSSTRPVPDKTTNTLIDYLSKWSPSLSKKDKQKKGFFDRMDHWDIIGSQSPQIILEKAGFLHQYVEADYVAETSILPFLGSADYVFCLDSSNNIVPLPKTFKDQLLDRGDIKKISNEPDLQWCVLSLITPRMGFMNGAISDSTLSVYKIIHDLGYRAYVYNFTNDENTEDEVVLNELKSFIGDIFAPRLRDKTL